MSTQALRSLLERGIPLSFFSSGGWYYGRAIGHDHKNVELRMAQWRGANDPALCLQLARGLTSAKIRNCRTLLRRNHPSIDETLLDEVRMAPVAIRDGGAVELQPLTEAGPVELPEPIGQVETIYTLHSEMRTFQSSFDCCEPASRRNFTTAPIQNRVSVSW